MAVGDDLKDEVKKFLSNRWTTRKGSIVPESKDLKLGNDAVILDGTVLYADMEGSTELVQGYKNWFAAEVYKSYLYCAARVIRSESGEITSYDGDRIMAVFIGDFKNNQAARSALKINYVVKEIINPAIRRQYPKTAYKVRHTIGVDTSKLFIARTGIRGSNDLVWVGRSANYAAKLTDLSADYPSWITEAVYKKLDRNSKYGNNGDLMWERRLWTPMNNHPIYRSNWQWSV